MTARCKVFGCDYPAGGCSGDCAPAHLTMPEVEWREPLGPVLRPGAGPAARGGASVAAPGALASARIHRPRTAAVMAAACRPAAGSLARIGEAVLLWLGVIVGSALGGVVAGMLLCALLWLVGLL